MSTFSRGSNSLCCLGIISGEFLASSLGHRLAIGVFGSCSQPQEISLIAFEPSVNLIGLARDKEVHSVVLVGQFIVKQILETGQRSVYVPWDRNGLTVIFRGIDLDQILEFVIIEIVWNRISSATLDLCVISAYCIKYGKTHMAPIVAQTAPGISLRTSSPPVTASQTNLQGAIVDGTRCYNRYGVS